MCCSSCLESAQSNLLTSQEVIMNIPRRRFIHLAGSAAALLAASRVEAQTYPTRPVRVIVPFAPGGPADIVARLLTQKLGERSGRQFFVENVAGAGGNLGMRAAARAAPDGIPSHSSRRASWSIRAFIPTSHTTRPTTSSR